jgi:uncharacterized membrane protein
MRGDINKNRLVKMSKYTKWGAIIGGLWGITNCLMFFGIAGCASGELNFPLKLLMLHFNITYLLILLVGTFLPPFKMSSSLGLLLLFSIIILVGVLIGASVGYVYGKWRNYK